MINKYLLGPRLGDVIHSLYIVKCLCDNEPNSAEIYLSYEIPVVGNYFTFGLDATYDDIYNIVMKQPYIKSFVKYDEKEIEGMIDLRTFNINYDTLYKYTWYESYNILYHTENKFKNDPWLIVINDQKYNYYKDKIIFNFSDGRYDDGWDEILESIIKNNDCIFITAKGDFRGYEKFKFKDLIELKECKSFHEIYSIIEKCKFYVGNQTMPLAIAHGLFKPHLGLLYKNDAIHYKDDFNSKYFWIDNRRRTSNNFNEIYKYIDSQKIEFEPILFDARDLTFDIDYNFNENRVYISSSRTAEINVMIYQIDDIDPNRHTLLNCNYGNFNGKSTMWFGIPENKKLSKIKHLKVRISKDDYILKEDELVQDIPDKKATISLSIIVKNEAKTITNMLDSVYSILDYYVVVDTGSEDNTKEIISRYFEEKNIPGEILDHPWINFGDARNFALEATISKADYGFWIDADDELLLDPDFNVDNFKRDILNYDGLHCKQINQNQYYYSDKSFKKNTIAGNLLTFFFSTTKPFFWYGPVHEVLLCKENANIIVSDDILILKHDTGSSWNEGSGKKYEKYAKVIEDYINKTNTQDPRWTFYCAQCYKDSGTEENYKKALDWYKKRIEMTNGFWEEIYYAQFEVANTKRMLNYPIHEVMEEYLKCGKYNNNRIEHLLPVIEYYQYIGEYNIAYLFSSYAVKFVGKPPANSFLFIDSSVYNWRIYDLHNLSCWWSGRIDEAKEVFKKLWEQVENEKVPADQIPRITENKKYNT